MSEREAGKEETKQKNPFLPTLSVRKWAPDREMMQSIDESMLKASGGAGREPDQWHKDDRYA